jgi:hypothetical protein
MLGRGGGPAELDPDRQTEARGGQMHDMANHDSSMRTPAVSLRREHELNNLSQVERFVGQKPDASAADIGQPGPEDQTAGQPVN